MDIDLVGYLLRALDPDAEQRVEAHVQSHPEAQRQLELLRRALEPLAADSGDFNPPPGLAVRTLARVAEYRCRELTTIPIPVATVPVSRTPAIWRRPDLLVAAVLLVAIVGLGVPKVVQWQGESRRIECANNLRKFSVVLTSYSRLHHGEYPAITDEPTRNYAGLYLPILNEAGVAGEYVSTSCPANGPYRYDPTLLRNLAGLTPDELRERARQLGGCYAYTLGYRDAEGRHHPLRSDPTDPENNHIPLMADKPVREGEGAGARQLSVNHRGGQNVLYIGGHVRFCTAPRVGVKGDHIYLNDQHEPRAGRHRWDSVLGLGDDQP
ncbi:MAG: hypothetical protein NZ700_11045 [Gemmataceae bacterium]|nr:hypothetical protein [Gemmataceae bacterium]MDW8265528.1 hypothetical protein [Gemmataceae bacterium]